MLAAKERLQAVARRRLALGNGANVEVGVDVEFERSSTVRCRHGGSIHLGDRVHISHGAYLSSHGGRLELGSDVYVGPFTVLYGAGGLTVGDDTRIAQHVSIVPGNHVFADVDTPIRLQGSTRKGVVVGRDVWLAANVTVLDGVTIGDGAVVAAGAVVNRDVEPYTVVGGVPARQIGRRGGVRDPAGVPSH